MWPRTRRDLDSRFGSSHAHSSADRAKECPDIGDVHVRNLVSREVAAMIVRGPPNDVPVIPFREPSDSVEVPAEPGEPDWNCRGLGRVLGVRILVVEASGR